MSVNGYLDVKVLHAILHVNIWSDKDCVGDLLTQADFRMGSVIGLSIRERGPRRAHWEDQAVLTVHLPGHAATFEGDPVEGFYDEFSNALDELRNA